MSTSVQIPPGANFQKARRLVSDAPIADGSLMKSKRTCRHHPSASGVSQLVGEDPLKVQSPYHVVTGTPVAAANLATNLSQSFPWRARISEMSNH